MKIPEFIPFHFDKFNSNLFKRQGAAGIGRWCMIRKAVAEMPTLYIDLNDPSDREGLELDTDSTPGQLSEMLDLAAQRGMIDPVLYSSGILWIENLDTDLGRFFTTGKRHLPKKPELRGKIPISRPDFVEKFHEVDQKQVQDSEKIPPLVGIPTHETIRNDTDETNEVLKSENPMGPISKSLTEANESPWKWIQARKMIQCSELIVKYTFIDTDAKCLEWEKYLMANKPDIWEKKDIKAIWNSCDWYLDTANNNAKKFAAEKRDNPKPFQRPIEVPKMPPLHSSFD